MMLTARRVMLAGLVRIALPGWTVRLCDGSAALTWGSETFTGKDSRFGVIKSVEMSPENVGDTMPSMSLTLLPPDLATAVQLSNPAMQGAQLRAWMAEIDRDAGTVLSADLHFAGEIDTVTLEVDRGERQVAIEVASVFSRFLEPDEGANLSDSFHQWIWPGELGMSNITGTPIKKLWGPGDKPPAATMVPQLPVSGVQRYF